MDEETLKKLMTNITELSKDHTKLDAFMNKYKPLVFECAAVTENKKTHLAIVFGSMFVGYQLAQLEKKYIN